MDVLIATLILSCTVLGSVVLNVVANELYDRGGDVSHWLARRAVARLPKKQQLRYEEEWLAHIDEVSGKLSKVWHALCFFLAASKIAKCSIPEASDNHIVISVRSRNLEHINLLRKSTLSARDFLWIAKTVLRFWCTGRFRFRFRIERVEDQKSAIERIVAHD